MTQRSDGGGRVSTRFRLCFVHGDEGYVTIDTEAGMMVSLLRV